MRGTYARLPPGTRVLPGGTTRIGGHASSQPGTPGGCSTTVRLNVLLVTAVIQLETRQARLHPVPGARPPLAAAR